jgi:AraC-like DNA-binding protein
VSALISLLPADENLSAGDKPSHLGLEHTIVSEIVRAETLRGFGDVVRELGGDGEALLRASGIDPAALADGDAYISYRRVISAIERAASELNAPDFGLRLAQATGASMLGPLSVAMYNAETVRAAITIARRFFHFHNPSIVLALARFDETCDFISLAVRMRRPPKHPQSFERGIATLHGFLATVCGSAYKPREVRFAHAALSPLPVYRAVFGVTPVFEAPEAGIALTRALIDAPQKGSNPQVRRIAEHFLESVAPPAAREEEAIAPRARQIIDRLLRAGEFEQADVARAFGLHERTLQRRLKAEDTSFETLRDQARRDWARALLSQRNVPFSHIAEVLGYAEASAFTRASQRWFGASPREVRRRVAA